MKLKRIFFILTLKFRIDLNGVKVNLIGKKILSRVTLNLFISFSTILSTYSCIFLVDLLLGISTPRNFNLINIGMIVASNTENSSLRKYSEPSKSIIEFVIFFLSSFLEEFFFAAVRFIFQNINVIGPLSQSYEELILFELLPRDRREARRMRKSFIQVFQLVETYTRLTLCL